MNTEDAPVPNLLSHEIETRQARTPYLVGIISKQGTIFPHLYHPSPETVSSLVRNRSQVSSWLEAQSTSLFRGSLQVNCFVD